MTAMPPLRDILNNTPADAINVDFNFNTVEAHVAQELINRDGSVAMTGPLSLSGPPTAAQHAATKGYVDTSAIPVGVIWEYAGVTAPTGWALCDGSSKSTTDPAYAALFAVIGYRHGGSGASFNLPDRRARMPVGYAPGDGLLGTLGARGGSRDNSLVQHQHDIAHAHGHSISATSDVKDTNHRHTIDHGHTATASPVPDHDHKSSTASDVGWWQFGGGTLGPKSVGDFTTGWNASNPTRTSLAGGHTPAITVVALSGGYSTYQHQVDSNTNYQHSHAITIAGSVTAAPAGTLSGLQGVAPANTNYPPYEVVNYIIRIG